MNIKVNYPGATEVKEFPGLFEAIEHIGDTGNQSNFLIKQSDSEAWEDGPTLFKKLRTFFEPA